MTALWPFVIFFNVIDVDSYKACLLINKDWNSGKLSQRRIFLEQLSYALVKPYIFPRAAATVKKRTSTPLVVQTAGRKHGRCQASLNRKDSENNNTCVKCKKYVCR